MNRKYLKIILMLLSTSSVVCQVEYDSILNNELKKYKANNSVIQSKLFDENMSTAFSNVIFSNSDLVSNTSAFGYSQNEEKTNVSINTNIKLKSTKYLRIGASATGSKSVFEFYSNDSWNNNVSFNIGYVFKVLKSSTSYSISPESKQLLNERRKISASKPIYEKKWYTKDVLDSLKDFKEDVLNRETGLKEKYTNILKNKPHFKKFIENKNYEALYKAIHEEKELIRKYLKVAEFGTKSEMESYIKNKLYEFDKQNDITYGYSLKWVDINLSLGNGTYKFTEDNIEMDIVNDFENEFDLSEDLNRLKTTLSLSFNHTKNVNNLVWYYQLGTSFSSGSFLENPLINGTPKIVQNDSGEFTIEDEDEKGLGKFSDIKDNLQTGSFNAYGALFFTKKKNFGFNVAIAHNYLIDKPSEVFYKNNFTTLFGPIFRKVKDNKTSLTFGIDLGWNNAIYNTKVTGDFTGRIRLGIPFNIYEKKKTKK
ncbi:hypothetical protein GCM10022393_31800 [Aquimarina addita]|uniref:DUF5723 domain-containing protein n=1 Tax=Aquimarina addita TaxID=870485 RepID=A0ABP6URV7_9FLAO